MVNNSQLPLDGWSRDTDGGKRYRRTSHITGWMFLLSLLVIFPAVVFPVLFCVPVLATVVHLAVLKLKKARCSRCGHYMMPMRIDIPKQDIPISIRSACITFQNGAVYCPSGYKGHTDVSRVYQGWFACAQCKQAFIGHKYEMTNQPSLDWDCLVKDAKAETLHAKHEKIRNRLAGKKILIKKKDG